MLLLVLSLQPRTTTYFVKIFLLFCFRDLTPISNRNILCVDGLSLSHDSQNQSISICTDLDTWYQNLRTSLHRQNAIFSSITFSKASQDCAIRPPTKTATLTSLKQPKAAEDIDGSLQHSHSLAGQLSKHLQTSHFPLSDNQLVVQQHPRNLSNVLASSCSTHKYHHSTLLCEEIGRKNVSIGQGHPFWV